MVTASSGKGTWRCTYVLELPEGHISPQAETQRRSAHYVFAVTGGTGLYRNAREADEKDTEVAEKITIHLEPRAARGRSTDQVSRRSS